MSRINGDTNRYRIRALGNGLAVLKMFDDQRQVYRLTEIAEGTGLPMATAFRAVTTLVEIGYLERTVHGLIQPALSVLTMGYSTFGGASLVEIADGPLLELAESTGQRIHLGVLAGADIVYLIRLGKSGLASRDIMVGTKMPAVYTSMGKALLSELTGRELDALLGDEPFPPGGGPRAVSSRAALDEQLAEVRRVRFSVQSEELAQGLSSVSVNLRGRGPAAIAAINLAVTNSEVEMDELVGPLLDRLRESAAHIEMRLRSARQ